MSTGIAEQHLKSQQQANGSGNSDSISESSVNYESWRSAAQPHQVFTPSTMSNVNSNYYYTTAAGTPIHYAPAASYIGNYNAVYTAMPPGPYYYSNGTPATGDYASVAQNHWNHYTPAPDNGKIVDSMQAMSLGAAPPVKKQPSWASIASQPPKPTVTTTLHVKKKGMPPPPMILNKLKLDPSPAPPTPPAPAPVYALPPPYTTLPQGLPPAHFLSTPPPHHVTVMSHPPPHLLSTPPPLPLQQTKDQIVECSEPYPKANSERSNCDNYTNEGEYHEDPSGAEVGDASRCYEPDHSHQNHHEPLMQRRSPTPSAEPPSQHSQNLDRPERSPKAPQYDEETASNLLEELKVKNNYNPVEYELPPRPRFFVIKSYSEDDIHRSIKYEIWCSTDHGNRKLDQAFSKQAEVDGSILLFFSVNRSGHFCGVARMMSSVDYNASSSVWSQDKWKGQFKVQWIYVKDVPNSHLKNIILETNENRPVTYCRDTTEVPYEKGIQVLQKIQQFPHTTSIFDDFNHYEQKQMAESSTQHHNDKDNHFNKDDGGRNNSYGNSNGYNKMRRSDRGEWRDNNSSSGGNRRGGGGDYHHQSRSNNYHRGGFNENYQRNYNGSGGYYNRNSGGYQKGERDYHRGDRDFQKNDCYRDREYWKNEYHRDSNERDFSHVRDWKNDRDFHPREFREQRDGRDYRDREIRRGRNDENENDH